MPRKTIEWQGYEYDHQEKRSDWFWALGILALAGATASVLVGNVLFAVVIVLGAFVLALYAARRPELKTFRLTERGLLIDDLLYSWSSLEAFWVEEDMPNRGPRLFIDSNKVLTPHMTIPLDEVNPAEVREYLRAYLPEEEHAESLTHSIMELLGF